MKFRNMCMRSCVVLMYVSSLVAAVAAADKTEKPTVTIFFHINNQHNIEQGVKQVVDLDISAPSPVPPQANFWDSSYATLRDNPWLVGGVVAGSAYALAVANLYVTAYICAHRCPWAHWKSELSALQLHKGASKRIAVELFAALSATYARESKQGDFLTPLVCFINALDAEIAWHRYFLKLHAWLDRAHVHFVFPQQQDARVQVTEQHERLLVLRSLLVDWLRSYTREVPDDVDAKV